MLRPMVSAPIAESSFCWPAETLCRLFDMSIKQVSVRPLLTGDRFVSRVLIPAFETHRVRRWLGILISRCLHFREWL